MLETQEQPLQAIDFSTIAESSAPGIYHAYPYIISTPQSSSKSLIWKSVIVPALELWAISRIVYVAITLVYLRFIRPESITLQSMAATWNKWDANWYLTASKGYPVTNSLAFFPLYPALIAGLTHFLGASNRVIASLIITNIAVFGIFIGLIALARLESQNKNSGRGAVLIALAYPLAFYLTAPYSESLFICFAVFAFYFARARRWKTAALFAFAAGFTHPTSIVLAPALFAEYASAQGWFRAELWRHGAWKYFRPSVSQIKTAALVTGAVPAALALYNTYIWRKTGSFFEYSAIQHNNWGHRMLNPLDIVFTQIQRIFNFSLDLHWHTLVLWNNVTIYLILLLTILMIRRMPMSYSVFMFSLIILLFLTPIPGRPDLYSSTVRLFVASFPLYIWLGLKIKDRIMRPALLLIPVFALQAFLLIEFFLRVWVE